MKIFFYGGLLTSWSLLSFVSTAEAQLSFTGQLRTRSEFRNGQGSPLPEQAKPAFFTSQRTRLSLGYATYRLKFGLTVQDVRVWGQDASTTNRTTTADNNGLMLHEAWAEIMLTDTGNSRHTASVKIGRQELVYDDVRLLGNLDWAQQARRHDAALFKYEHNKWMFHTGVAFNQNKENASGTVYNSTPPGNYPGGTNGAPAYKSMQFLYAGKKLANGNASFLFFADQFSKFHLDNINNQPVKTFEQGSWTRMTTGIYWTNAFKKINYTLSGYYQFGKNPSGQSLRAELLSALLQYNFTKRFSAGAGLDYTSGGGAGNTSHAFDPLYGTPHKFWGYMDYFYVGNGFGNKGLLDYYLKTTFKAGTPFRLTLDVHEFVSATQVINSDQLPVKRRFGTEIDLTGNYALTKMIGFEAGYSHFFSTGALSSPGVKNIPNARTNSDWAYIMINIRPEFIFK